MTLEPQNNGEVLTIRYVGTSIIKEFFDMQYHTEIGYNADTLTIRTRDYLGADYLFNGTIPVSINGVESVLQAVNGVVTIPHVASSYDVVKTNLEGFRNGELVLGAPPIPPDPIQVLQNQVNELTVTLGDLILGGL